MTDKLTELDIYSLSTRNSKVTISLTSHFLNFSANPHLAHLQSHANQRFAIEPNFTDNLNRIITSKEYKHER